MRRQAGELLASRLTFGAMRLGEQRGGGGTVQGHKQMMLSSGQRVGGCPQDCEVLKCRPVTGRPGVTVTKIWSWG